VGEKNEKRKGEKMGVVLQWSLKKIINMICNILLNKFDCFIVLEGNRGLGKSTLAYHIAKGVSKEMKRRGIDEYKFFPKAALLYERTEVLRFFHQWKRNGIADEMINVSFNRDFYNEEQKDLIKMMNMNRDHCNLFQACVPQFQTLDSQMKNLCKLRLTVVRRGVAVVQTPNRTIYARDKWDQQTNEKIERDWLKKGIQNPHYSKLTTFRGLVRFPALTEKQEVLYQSIKNEKRNKVAREQMGILDDEGEKDLVVDAANMLEKGQIRNAQIIEGMAYALGKLPDTFKRSIMTHFKKLGKQHKLSDYYWDNKKKKGEVTVQEEANLHDLINSIGDKK